MGSKQVHCSKVSEARGAGMRTCVFPNFHLS